MELAEPAGTFVAMDLHRTAIGNLGTGLGRDGIRPRRHRSSWGRDSLGRDWRDGIRSLPPDSTTTLSPKWTEGKVGTGLERVIGTGISRSVERSTQSRVAAKAKLGREVVG